MPPVSQSGILQVDFITLYLSSDNGLLPAELNVLHDPNGILQAIIGRLENRFYTEDNRVEYLRTKNKHDVYLYVFKPKSYLYS